MTRPESPFLTELPTLETSRLVLTRICEGDAEGHWELLSSDPDAAYFLEPEPLQSVEDVRAKYASFEQKFFVDNSVVGWTIRLKESRDYVGFVGLVRWDKSNYRSEIAYGIQLRHAKSGFATEALTRAIEFGFGEMRLHRIEAHIDPVNERSRRLVERLGFTHEATLRENTVYGGKFVDTCLYAKLNEAG